ncbi:anti-sigma-K factor RskA [Hoeflea marina]|uniref:Anti-sigma-K factor RskA n=1 Tax=Hoeflea marina TaxID=274592 RepID=A0A317PM22_9HYPH|nr:anti-sigma factor [Hoeflea marina]PWW02005.1 anti-sigma-K factor RskA [Hoeflea marina]
MSPSSQTRHDESGRDIALAGEYVLGVLPFAERRAAEDRMLSDSDFAALVAHWQADFAELNPSYAPEPVPARLARVIEARLFGDAPSRTPGLWGSLVFWRGLSVAAIVAAVGLAGLSSGLFPSGTGGPAAPLVAQLSGPDSPIGLIATLDPGSDTLNFVPAAFVPDGEKSLELWLVPSDGSAAISMGLVPPDGGAVKIDKRLVSQLDDGALLAVSLEPPGGSPTGVATGPVLVSGKLLAK